MKKILFFVNCNGVGGAERMSITLAKSLDKERFLPVFVLVGQKDRISQFIPDEFKTIKIKIKNIYDFLIFKIYDCLKLEKPDLVFSSQVFLNVRLIFATRLMDGVHVVIRHPNAMSTINGLNRVLINLTYKFANVIVAQQEEMADELRALPGVGVEKIKVLHNPIDINTIQEKLKNSSSPYENISGIKFVNVGSIKHIKGQDILLRAFLQIHKTLPDSHLFIVGRIDEKKYYSELYSFIKYNSLEQCIHFVGYTDNPYIWMKNADCFVLSSRCEGLPNVLIEASFLNVPVVSTLCIPMVKRIIEENVNGFVVPIDNPDSMAYAMLHAIKLKNVAMSYIPASVEEINATFLS